MSNRLADETSPYLLQHKDNPVDWYPWCDEAFARASAEDKPVFLSIGYSACHWCHVLAHESFEDDEIAAILNEHFISVKVDREERPDVDSVYMAVCQAFTGSGGWPLSIFMTSDGKPFFAGTYFPKTAHGGMIGFRELLLVIREKWTVDRAALLRDAESIIAHLHQTAGVSSVPDADLTHPAAAQYARIYDEVYGGFGGAPKFPTPHNLLFLLEYYERHQTSACLHMAEHTLIQMYRGGMFDHIGFGFCRYSTDDCFLVPHFEKMLYDNALLILAYCKAYTVTGKAIYLEIAEKTAAYILREMTAPDGGFYSAQDADSDGGEGSYYLFTPEEIIDLLGEEHGTRFNRHYDITETGNFEEKNIPNLLKSDPRDRSSDAFLSIIYEYRKQRYTLRRDEKLLTSWNSLMIAAMCRLYLVSGRVCYLTAAQRADAWIQNHLWDGDTLYVSGCRGEHGVQRGVRGFLDDYAAYITALLSLYRATLSEEYLACARRLADKVTAEFGDEIGGFYLYSSDHETLILRPKETYDGAIPSGNSLMAYHLVQLSLLTDEEQYGAAAKRQLDFLARSAVQDPTGHAVYLSALLAYNDPPTKITIVLGEDTDPAVLARALPQDAMLVLRQASEAYPLKNGKTTYYVCRGHRCFPPDNELV